MTKLMDVIEFSTRGERIDQRLRVIAQTAVDGKRRARHRQHDLVGR
mgnify:CR=1 FL=1